MAYCDYPVVQISSFPIFITDHQPTPNTNQLLLCTFRDGWQLFRDSILNILRDFTIKRGAVDSATYVEPFQGSSSSTIDISIQYRNTPTICITAIPIHSLKRFLLVRGWARVKGQGESAAEQSKRGSADRWSLSSSSWPLSETRPESIYT